MNKKKIVLYVITAIITFALVFGILLVIEKRKANKMVKDFDKAFIAKDKKLIFYARKTCYFCQLQKPILKQVSKDYNLDYVNIDGDMLTKKQQKHIWKKLGIDGSTPVTAIVKNKKVLAVHVGYLDGKEYVDFLRESGMLPADAIYKPEKNLTHINYDEFNNLENGILVLGMNADQDCIDLRESLNSIAEELKININYFNLSRTTKDEFYDVLNQLEYMNNNKFKILNDDENIIIPLVIVIKDSKIIKVIDDLDESKIKTELKKYKK